MNWSTIPRWSELRRVVAELRMSVDYLRDRCASHDEMISKTRLEMLERASDIHTRLDGTIPALHSQIGVIKADAYRVNQRVAALESTVTEEFRKLAKLIEERTPPVPGIPAGEWPFPPPPDDAHMTVSEVHDRATEIAKQHAIRKAMAQAVIVRVDDDPEALEITRDQWASLKALFRERP